jgi:hypothetical protein
MGKTSKLPSSQQPSAVKQFKVQSSAWGGVVPVIYGEARVAGNIVSTWHFTSKVDTSGLGSFVSGKAGGGPNALKQYSYHVALVLLLGEGGPSIAQLLWAPHADDRLNLSRVPELDAHGHTQVAYVPRFVAGEWTTERVMLVDRFDCGLATPGAQVMSVQPAGSPNAGQPRSENSAATEALRSVVTVAIPHWRGA